MITLADRLTRLRGRIIAEQEYCLQWAAAAGAVGDTARQQRHLDRANQLGAIIADDDVDHLIMLHNLSPLSTARHGQRFIAMTRNGVCCHGQRLFETAETEGRPVYILEAGYSVDDLIGYKS